MNEESTPIYDALMEKFWDDWASRQIWDRLASLPENPVINSEILESARTAFAVSLLKGLEESNVFAVIKSNQETHLPSFVAGVMSTVDTLLKIEART